MARLAPFPRCARCGRPSARFRLAAYAIGVITAADGDARAEIRALWQRVAGERHRAARAASVAARHDARQALAPESLRSMHATVSDLHRKTEARHLEAARLTEVHAIRMEGWLNGAVAPALRPVFMAAVASVLGTRGAMAALRGRRHAVALVAASDADALAAHDLELVLAEGPVSDVVALGTPLTVTGTALLERWPRYGPAVAELGVRAVTAAPLGPPGLGALCAYAAEPAIGVSTAATDWMARALTQMVLADDILPDPPVFDEASYRAVVHQAAGVVSVHCGCDVDAAEDLLTARAFADGVPVEEIAAQVMRGETRLR